jgi:hypothetical protein
MSEQKYQCGRCNQFAVEESFSKNNPGCALPGGWFIFACFMTWVFPTLGFLFWPVFIILLVVGIKKQREHNRSNLTHFKCKNCSTEYTWDGNKQDWV